MGRSQLVDVSFVFSAVALTTSDGHSFLKIWLVSVETLETRPFLVGTFSFKGKMPDSYSDYFLQPTDLTLKRPLFTETTKTT